MIATMIISAITSTGIAMIDYIAGTKFTTGQTDMFATIIIEMSIIELVMTRDTTPGTTTTLTAPGIPIITPIGMTGIATMTAGIDTTEMSLNY